MRSIASGIAGAFVVYLLFVIVEHFLNPTRLSLAYTVVMSILAFPFLPLLSLAKPAVSLPAYTVGGVLFYFGFIKLQGWTLTIYLTVLFSILTFIFLFVAMDSFAGT